MFLYLGVMLRLAVRTSFSIYPTNLTNRDYIL